MKKSRLNLFFELEEEIEIEAKKVFIWYLKNILNYTDFDYYFDYIDGKTLWFEHNVFNDERITIPSYLLTMTDEELEKKKIHYFEEKKEKEKEREIEEIEKKKAEAEATERGEYKLYLELKKKFEKKDYSRYYGDKKKNANETKT